MAVPSAKDARFFYRCASERYEDAEILIRAERTTGAVYMAGYGIECILKALILSVVPPGNIPSVLESFRGNLAHDYNWLRDRYRTSGGTIFPRDVNHQFTLVNYWSTDLRDLPRTLREGEAEAFLKAAEVIIHCARGRLRSTWLSEFHAAARTRLSRASKGLSNLISKIILPQRSTSIARTLYPSGFG